MRISGVRLAPEQADGLIQVRDRGLSVALLQQKGGQIHMRLRVARVERKRALELRTRRGGLSEVL